jgi:hypothetical protein
MQVREDFWTTIQYTPAKRAGAKLALTISGKVAAPASNPTQYRGGISREVGKFENFEV